jgi:hypothetical protein
VAHSTAPQDPRVVAAVGVLQQLKEQLQHAVELQEAFTGQCGVVEGLLAAGQAPDSATAGDRSESPGAEQLGRCAEA